MSGTTDSNCSLCYKAFRDPVTLDCDHTFCFKCLKKLCKENKKTCPSCKRRFSKSDLDNFRMKQPTNVQKTESPCAAREHADKWVKFCQNEQRVLCLDCDFQHDSSHKILSVEETVKNLKKDVNLELQAMQDQRDRFKKMEQTYKEMMDHSEKLVETTEKQIKKEFMRIQQFLREDEEFKLKALREERDGKKRKIMKEMKILKKQISTLSESIFAIEQELQKNDVSFIYCYEEVKTSAKAQCSSPDPTIELGLLVNAAKHVGNLGFRIWQKMKDTVHFTPVILDPNTANPHLWLSDDLSSVRCSDTPQDVPDNPERNSHSVLGATGFSSRIHSWDVQVGDHPDWTIGVANMPVDMKKQILAPQKHGMWCLTLRDGEYGNGNGERIRVQKKPEKIRVQVDYDEGQVSFHDCEDDTHVYSHKHTFREKLFPYFAVGVALDAKSTGISVCPKDSRKALERMYSLGNISKSVESTLEDGCNPYFSVSPYEFVPPRKITVKSLRNADENPYDTTLTLDNLSRL